MTEEKTESVESPAYFLSTINGLLEEFDKNLKLAIELWYGDEEDDNKRKEIKRKRTAGLFWCDSLAKDVEFLVKAFKDRYPCFYIGWKRDRSSSFESYRSTVSFALDDYL